MKKPPEKYVYFHKTHKCSSTTIQNILFRYAMNNDLILVLPKHGGHFTFKSYKFNAQMVQDTAWIQAQCSKIQKKSEIQESCSVCLKGLVLEEQ